MNFSLKQSLGLIGGKRGGGGGGAGAPARAGPSPWIRQ